MSKAAARIRQTICCIIGGVIGCATVVQEEPPSTQDPSASVGGSGVSPPGGNGGAGGSFSAGGSSAVGRGGTGFSMGGTSTGSGGATNGSAGQPARGGAGGSAGGVTVEPEPQFPSGTVLLEENFEEFEPADWIAAPDGIWALTTDPDLDGNVYGQTETGSSAPHLVTSGDLSWTNVVVEADIKVLAFNGSASGYMAGVCLRVSDAENFYMVGLRSNGLIQLRSFSDTDTNLADSSDVVGAVGTLFHLRVQVVGQNISVFVDDVMMFTHTNATHTNGGVGLCTVRASAVFDNIVVTAP